MNILQIAFSLVISIINASKRFPVGIKFNLNSEKMKIIKFNAYNLN